MNNKGIDQTAQMRRLLHPFSHYVKSRFFHDVAHACMLVDNLRKRMLMNIDFLLMDKC